MTLGGKRAIMVYTGVAHAPDSTALYFPDERNDTNLQGHIAQVYATLKGTR